MVFEQITGFVGLLLGPITVLQPILAITVFSLVFTLVVYGMNRLIVKKKVVDEIKAKMAEVRENLERAQKENNKDNIQKHLQEMMEMNSKFMKHSFKGMIVPLALAVLLLPWINSTYGSVAVAQLPFALPFIGVALNGLYWYIIVSLAFGWVINSTLGGRL
jgi:uncharacterized membrane protein (DUF106 family)